MKKRHDGGLLLVGLPWQQVEGQVLSASEIAELHRQGAKAAVRGESSEANPMCGTMNLPTSTGEQPSRWSRRHDAWQAGHDAYAPAKPDVSEPDSQAMHVITHE